MEDPVPEEPIEVGAAAAEE